MIRAFSMVDTCIGSTGIGWSDRGLRRVWIGEETPKALRAAIAAEAPGAEEARPPEGLRALPADLAAHVWGEPRTMDPPIDWRGITAFRRAVYEALRGTGVGELVTYGELASRAGRAAAARAVGGAMARNPMPVVIPCHRVVGVGHAGGYSAPGGLRTKTLLVTREGARLPGVRLPPYDPGVAMGVLRRDRRLRPAIAALGTFALTLRPRTTVFASLARAIVHQQLSGKAAGTILARVVEACGGELGPEAVEELDDGILRGAGLSRPKLRALRDLSERVRGGTLPDRDELDAMDDEAIVAALTEVRGIGRWTVEMLLLFQLGRPDVLAVDDLGLRKGWGRLVGREVSRDELAEAGEAWRPYRSAASWYLWRLLDGLP